ncbi:hypothetical protein [Sphingomonas sp.]|uniref:hypothetical protein n=1 Tax=Sphingomonas sp. TaxID=28214 RepID=UPI003B3ACFF1
MAAAILLGMWIWGAPHIHAGSSDDGLEQSARRFVRLGLALRQIAPEEIDGYFGSPPNEAPADESTPRLATMDGKIGQLMETLRQLPASARRDRLLLRSQGLRTLVGLIERPGSMPFEEEQRRLYGIATPPLDQAAFARVRAELNRLLPGEGSLGRRIEAYRRSLIVPEAARPALFARALAECRRRTRQHWSLPANEQTDVEWTGAVDAAWHNYQGEYRSTLRVNPQAVAFIGSAVDVACHEGYPGHHTQFVLAEMGGLHVEDRLVFLRSAGSALREGAAEYGVSLVFPPDERLGFERDVLFPMAGLPPAEAARFERVRQLSYALAPAALPILRAYRDGRIDRDEAADALEHDALIASPRALIAFVDSLGAYSAGYTAARVRVQSAVERGAPTLAARWDRLACLIRAADDAPLRRPTAIPCSPAVTGGPTIKEVG